MSGGFFSSSALGLGQKNDFFFGDIFIAEVHKGRFEYIPVFFDVVDKGILPLYVSYRLLNFLEVC